MKLKSFLLAFLAALSFVSLSHAEAYAINGGYPCSLGLTTKDVEASLKSQKVYPLAVYETPICGLFQVVLRGKKKGELAVRYITGDGRMFFSIVNKGTDGQVHLFEVKNPDTGKVFDWTSIALIRAAPFRYLDPKNAIVEGPKWAPVIAVFSDPECVHCIDFARKLRPYIKSGKIRVMTFLYPLRGSFNDIQAIWCSKNKAKAWNSYVNGDWDIPSEIKDCETPSAANLRMGRILEIQRTPTIILPGGKMIAGKPDNIDNLIELAKRQSNLLRSSNK